MASSKDYLQFVLEQLSELQEITYRAMMGEFIIYYRGKIVGGIYDDRLLVKPTKSAISYMPTVTYEIRYNIYFHIGYTLLLGNLSDRIEALPTDAWLYPAACLRSSDSLSQTKRCSAGESLSSLTTRFAYSRESDECLLARIQRSGFRLSNLRRDGAPTRCSAMLWQFGERCPNAYCVWFPDCFRT